VGWSRSQLRAFACAVGIAATVITARLALATLALSRADELATDALASATVLVLAAVAIASFSGEPLAQRLGLGASGLGAARVALCAIGLAALSHAAEGVVALAGISTAGLVRFDDALAGLHVEDLAFPLTALALASAIGEELFFRGMLQRGLAPRLGTAAAIVLSSLAFGAAHDDWAQGAAATVLGTYLGVVTARTGSIRPAIVAHAVNNALALLERSLGFEPPGSPIATGLAIAAGLALGAVGLRSVWAGGGAALQRRTGCTDEPSDA
jgi:membrane protease YdiL (CAAX protease family)